MTHGKLSDIASIDSCIDVMHYAFQQCYHKAFPSGFSSKDKKTDLSNMICMFTVDIYISLHNRLPSSRNVQNGSLIQKLVDLQR